MNSFYYRGIPKTLELAIKKLDLALKPLNTVKIEYVMKRHPSSVKHHPPEPASRSISPFKLKLKIVDACKHSKYQIMKRIG
jgi:hypothetical protein